MAEEAPSEEPSLDALLKLSHKVLLVFNAVRLTVLCQ